MKKIQVCFPRKLLPSWTQQEAARRPTSHRLPGQAQPKAPWSWSTPTCHHCCLWAALGEEKWGREEITLTYPSVQDLHFLLHLLPAQKQQMLLDWLSWRADPRVGKGSHSWAPQKANPKTKMLHHHSLNLWLWQRNEASEMQEETHTCSFPKYPCPHYPARQLCLPAHWTAFSRRFEFSVLGQPTRLGCLQEPKICPVHSQLWSPVWASESSSCPSVYHSSQAPGLFGHQSRWACMQTDTPWLARICYRALQSGQKHLLKKTCCNSKYTCI